jgi:uncharacterized protein
MTNTPVHLLQYPPRNVLGGALQPCCMDPQTGYYRDGYCNTGPMDAGSHTVCVIVTEEFLAFSKAAGNDLSTPKPEWDFPGLKPGDGWCVCAARWREAQEAGFAAPIKLEATHERALEIINLDVLKRYAIQ